MLTQRIATSVTTICANHAFFLSLFQGAACTVPTRATIAIMVFLGAVFFYMVRANFSLNLLAMVEKHTENGSLLEQPDFGPRIAWTPLQQSQLLGAFFYGYTVAAIPIGFVVERYGVSKLYILIALVVCTVLEALSPWAAQNSFGAMIGIRLAMGLIQSAYFPATHKLYSTWAPRNELGIFCFASLGSSAGTLFTMLGTGVLIEWAGWHAAFYLPAVILLVFTLAWHWLVFETPDDHPRIGADEREYIARNLPNLNKGNVRCWNIKRTGMMISTKYMSQKLQTWPPLRSIVRSPPCWALLLLQFGSDWGLYFVLTGVPKFLNEVLGFQIGSTGMLACLPYLSRWLMSFVFGLLSDVCISRGWLSVTNFRKLATVFCRL